MAQGVLHSYRKEQREAVNDLVRKVIVTDMANFNPERFRDWAKNLNYQFRQSRVDASVRYSPGHRTFHG